MTQVETSPHSASATPIRRWRRARRIIAPTLVLSAAVILWGSYRAPTAPAEGATLNGVATRALPSGSAIRVGTYNIGSGLDVHRHDNLQQQIQRMDSCDLIDLNEVRGPAPWQSVGQAQLIGERLKMPWLFAPVERRWWHEDFGNAVVSSLPVEHWLRVPISPAGSASNRNLVLLKVRNRDLVLNVIITHLGRQRQRDAQLRLLRELFLSLQPPAILLGDLNTPPDDPELRKLIETKGVVDCIGELGPRASGHIDWILERGMRCKNVGEEGEGVCDHPFFWAELEPQN